VVIIHNLFSQIGKIQNIKVETLSSCRQLWQFLEFFGRFLLFKVEILTEHSVLKMAKKFHQKTSLMGWACAFMQGLHTHFGSEHYMLKLASTLLVRNRRVFLRLVLP
jgi:hypothetical protein